jgi:hypothetical protein
MMSNCDQCFYGTYTYYNGMDEKQEIDCPFCASRVPSNWRRMSEDQKSTWLRLVPNPDK